MEANQQSVRAQQTRADRGSIQERVRRTDDIICSQQSRLTWTWLQGLRDNTSFPQNVEGVFQPSSTALLPCLRRQALGKLHRLPSHRPAAAPTSHEPEFGRFPCTTPALVGSTGGHEPPKISTHARKVTGRGKAALQEGLSLLQSERTGPLQGHRGSRVRWNEGRPSAWPNVEDRGKERQETDLLLSLSIMEWEPVPGRERTEPKVRIKGGGRGTRVGRWRGSCHNEGWWWDRTSRTSATTDTTLEGSEGEEPAGYGILVEHNWEKVTCNTRELGNSCSGRQSPAPVSVDSQILV